MNKIEPIYDDASCYAIHKPYIVQVNGKTLLRKDTRPRRFKDSMTATVAGAKEVDRLRALSQGGNP